MKNCWSEGELRAYIDRELPADAIEQVAAHLEECSRCGDLWADLAGRAGRVSAMMQELSAPSPVVVPMRMPKRTVRVWRWAGVAAAALAAGIAIGIAMMPRLTPPVAVANPPAPAPATVVEAPLAPVLPPAAPPRAVTASARPRPRPAVPALQSNRTFLALDDEPIESGVVWRVELGPRQVPAEVIVDPDGRPRAIRLVNSKSNY